MEPLVCVLVGKGFLHRLGALKEQNWISSGFWRLEAQHQGAGRLVSSDDSPWLAEGCLILTWPFICPGVSFSFSKMPVLSDEEPHLQIWGGGAWGFTWGWGLQTVNFRGTRIQFRTVSTKTKNFCSLKNIFNKLKDKPQAGRKYSLDISSIWQRTSILNIGRTAITQ